jgi:hypothetical protein
MDHEKSVVTMAAAALTAAIMHSLALSSQHPSGMLPSWSIN